MRKLQRSHGPNPRQRQPQPQQRGAPNRPTPTGRHFDWSRVLGIDQCKGMQHDQEMYNVCVQHFNQQPQPQPQQRQQDHANPQGECSKHLEQLQQRHGSLVQENKQLQRRHASLVQDNEHLQRRHAGLKHARNTEHQQCAQLNNHFQELQEEHSKVLQEYHILQHQHERLQRANANLQKSGVEWLPNRLQVGVGVSPGVA